MTGYSTKSDLNYRHLYYRHLTWQEIWRKVVLGLVNELLNNILKVPNPPSFQPASVRGVVSFFPFCSLVPKDGYGSYRHQSLTKVHPKLGIRRVFLECFVFSFLINQWRKPYPEGDPADILSRYCLELGHLPTTKPVTQRRSWCNCDSSSTAECIALRTLLPICEQNWGSVLKKWK